MVWRAHESQNEAVGRPAIGSVHVRAIDLALAVEADDPGAHGTFLARQLRSGRRVDNGINDLEVARAAAEDAGQRILHLGPIGPGRAGEQVSGRHQHARRADPALGSTMGQERVVQPLVARVGRQAFNRDHAPPGALPDRDEAGADLLTIQQDGAGSAIASIAADLGAGEAKFLAQQVGEAAERRSGRRHRPAVHGQLQRVGRGLGKPDRHGIRRPGAGRRPDRPSRGGGG
jgi:hypothetical protein